MRNVLAIKKNFPTSLAFIAIYVLLFAVNETTRAESNHEISHSEIRKTLEQESQNYCYKVIIGKISIRESARGGDLLKDRIVSRQTARNYKLLEEYGFIEISNFENFTDPNKSNFSWNKWRKLTMSGIVGELTVSPTDKGLSLQNSKDFKPSTGWLCMDTGTANYTDILESSVFEKNGNTYANIKGVYEFTWSELKPFFAAKGHSMSTRWKYITLLEYDVFEDRWIRVATDSAPAGEKFNTNSVETYFPQ